MNKFCFRAIYNGRLWEKELGVSALVRKVIMPPTLKKLMGHIAFGASVSAWVRHTFSTYCNFKTVTARVLKFHMWIPHKK